MNKNRIIVALDVETAAEAREIINQLRGQVAAFKIGLQLFAAAGASFVRETVESGAKVFLDLKFHDIPNTAAKASVEVARMGVWMFNLHTLGGGEMMRKSVELVGEVCEKENLKKPKIIGVTVLTSSNRETLREVGIEADTNLQVLNLAKLAKKSDLDGVVASPHEAAAIRENVEDENFLIVTPGIRNPASNLEAQRLKVEDRFETSDDQKRVMSAIEAVRAGSNFLVVGRPILQAEDKSAAVRKILEEINL